MDGCIYVFFEGYKDEQFFSRVLRPILARRYADIVPWQYAQRSEADVKRALKSVQERKADSLFLRDMDNCPCVTARKQDLLNIYRKRIDSSGVVVVVKEIESWYLAGLDDESRQELGISPNRYRHTDELTKEQFESLVPTRFDSVVDFMNSILDRFQIKVAKDRNRSFCYLMDRLEGKAKGA
jgi:hypothetical protein